MCKFEYNGKCEKLEKFFDAMCFVAIFVLIVGLINAFVKFVSPDITMNIIYWLLCVMAIMRGAFNLYTVNRIKTSPVEITIEHKDINNDDPLQKSVISQAITVASEWAEFALKKEIKRLKQEASSAIAFGIVLALSLICMYFG